MKNVGLAFTAIGGLLLAACGGDDNGLQADGSIRLALSTDTSRHATFSAPILPLIDVLGQAGGYPSTLEERIELAKKASLLFTTLLTQCAAQYPAIKIPKDGDTLTLMERETNYKTVAECAYESFTTKPYWIPQLISDVDICGLEFGAGWRLPTEADFADLSEADFAFVDSALNGTFGIQSLSTYYLSLHCYVRATDGSLKIGVLNGGAPMRIKDLGVPTSQYGGHYEFDDDQYAVSLRCINRTDATP